MKVFLLKDLSKDCVDAVIISKNDNMTAQEIQDSINKTKEQYEYDWQWEDIVNSLPKDCEIYDIWKDLETVVY